MCGASISVESSDYFTGPDNYSCSGNWGQGWRDPWGWICHPLVYVGWRYGRACLYGFILNKYEQVEKIKRRKYGVFVQYSSSEYGFSHGTVRTCLESSNWDVAICSRTSMCFSLFRELFTITINTPRERWDIYFNFWWQRDLWCFSSIVHKLHKIESLKSSLASFGMVLNVWGHSVKVTVSSLLQFVSSLPPGSISMETGGLWSSDLKQATFAESNQSCHFIERSFAPLGCKHGTRPPNCCLSFHRSLRFH